MPGTIKINLSITWTNGDGDSIKATAAKTLDQEGDGAYSNTQVIGATSEALTIGADISGECFIFFKNNNAEWSELTDSEQDAYASEDAYNDANRVYIDTATATSSSKTVLKPGQGTFVAGVYQTYNAIRDTDNVALQFTVIEA